MEHQNEICYLNDGFIYCILTNLKHEQNQIPLVKIGKIEMKRQDTDEQVYNKFFFQNIQ
jgi:hypothetical protein